MVEYETRIKQWGNSFGIIIPKERLKEENIRENQMIKVLIKPVKRLKVKDIFGKIKNWNIPTKEIIKRIDKELGSKYLGE